ncbi:MAG: hypothetical protein ACRYG6_04785 [Janthinobacterium lividum]
MMTCRIRALAILLATASLPFEGIAQTAGSVLSANDITATGATQATALPIASTREIVTSVPSGTGVLLVTALGETRIYNHDPHNPLLIYPPVGGAFDGQALNLPVQLLAGSAATCMPLAAGPWFCSN